VRYRLLLLPPNAGMVDRLLQRLPQVLITQKLFCPARTETNVCQDGENMQLP